MGPLCQQLGRVCQERSGSIVRSDVPEERGGPFFLAQRTRAENGIDARNINRIGIVVRQRLCGKSGLCSLLGSTIDYWLLMVGVMMGAVRVGVFVRMQREMNVRANCIFRRLTADVRMAEECC